MYGYLPVDAVDACILYNFDYLLLALTGLRGNRKVRHAAYILESLYGSRVVKIVTANTSLSSVK